MYLLYALYVVYLLYGLYFLREKALTRSRERPGCTRETPREEVTNKSAAARVWKKTNQTGSGKITYYIVKRRKVAKKVTQPCRNSVSLGSNQETLIAISGQTRGPRTIWTTFPRQSSGSRKSTRSQTTGSDLPPRGELQKDW